MKKRLYIFILLPMLFASCDETIFISRDYDINAEFTEPVKPVEMSALYCNLNDAVAPSLQELEAYLQGQAEKVGVVMFVAPTTIGGEKFATWLTTYAGANGWIATYTSQSGSPVLTMAALVKEELIPQTYTTDSDGNQVPQAKKITEYSVIKGTTLTHNALHFVVADVHFVVAEFATGKNSIPDNWMDQLEEIADATNSKTAIEFDPDHNGIRRGEAEWIIANTVDNERFLTDTKWVLAIKSNVWSNVDLRKYGKEFLRSAFYDNVTEEYLASTSEYLDNSEYLEADDLYFGPNTVMLHNGLADAVAHQNSIFVPSSVDATRHNFVYLSNKTLNMMQSLEVDSKVANQLGVQHYPIMITLNIEE